MQYKSLNYKLKLGLNQAIEMESPGQGTEVEGAGSIPSLYSYATLGNGAGGYVLR